MSHITTRDGVPQFLTPAQAVERWINIPFMTAFGVSVIFLAAFFNLVDVSVDKSEVALDWQVALKLAICGGCGLYGGFGALTDSRVRKILLGFPGAWMMIILGFYFVSVLTAFDFQNSLASTVCLATIILSSVTAIVQIGLLPVLNTIFWAVSLFVVGSWFLFLAVPEIGVFAEPLADGQFINRMAGLSHPNALGQFSGVAILLGVVLNVTYGYRSVIRNLLILMAVAALIFSVSRAAAGATLIALMVAYRIKLFHQKYVIYYLILGSLGIMGLLVLSTFVDIFQFVENRLAALSKSGDAEELTTATGRTQIWAYVIELIWERPFTGWGAASSKHLLVDYSMYTHNLVLNVALSTGVLGGLAALMMCLTRIGQLFTRRHPMCDGIIVLICVNGLVENVMFSVIAGMPTILWIIGLVWWQLESDSAIVPPNTEVEAT